MNPQQFITQPVVQQNVGLVQEPVTYMEQQVVRNPVLYEQNVVVQRERPPKVVSNVYELNPPRKAIFDQPPVITYERPSRYPTTYRISPPKIRPPRRIQEELVVVKPPRQEVVKQQYV